YPIERNNENVETTTRRCHGQAIQFGGVCGVITRSMAKLFNNRDYTTSEIIKPNNPSAIHNSIDSASFPGTNQGPIVPKTTTDQYPPATTSPFSLDKIRNGQQSDEYIQQKMHEITLNPKTDSIIKDSIVYKCLMRNGHKIHVPYVPTSMIQQLLFHAHDHPTAGHFGRDKTWNNLKDKWYWPKMYTTIQHYIRSCENCARFNIRRAKQPGQLQPIEAPEGVMEMIGIDFCGPTQVTEEGNRYIIVATDYLSKFVIAKAVPDCSATTAAKFLVNEVAFKYGIPNQILSDNGSHFVAEIFEHVAKLLGCNRILATPYHPQTKWQVEIFNATMKSKLATLQYQHENDWNNWLSSVIYAYNNSQHSTTDFSPFQLMFGRKPIMPYEPGKHHFALRKPNDYLEHFHHQLKILHTAARQNTQQQQQTMKQRYDRNRPNIPFKVGQLVFVRNPGASKSAFDQQFIGPFTIIQQLGQQTFEVEDSSQQTRQVHSNQLKLMFE
ncbi:unnamed protein product, partial [Didymodactylos carnosus]